MKCPMYLQCQKSSSDAKYIKLYESWSGASRVDYITSYSNSYTFKTPISVSRSGDWLRCSFLMPKRSFSGKRTI
jgi:hypothetical protein